MLGKSSIRRAYRVRCESCLWRILQKNGLKKGTELALFDEKDQFVQTVTIASHRKQKNFDIIKFKDMYHINAIEKYKGYSLKVAEKDLNDLDDGEFYYHEIIGLEVYEVITWLELSRKSYNQVPTMSG